MFETGLTRDEALELLTQYNHEEFHLRHALTVEKCMRWFADNKGYADEADFWAIVGLLHDIDFELYPEEHCVKAVELLEKGGATPELIHAVTCHGYGMTGTDAKPEHPMEKTLFAVDELTGIVWAAALMRPSKSVQDMELKSLKKKFKSKSFAAGCSRETISEGAQIMGVELADLMQDTIYAMREYEDQIKTELAELTGETDA